MTMRTHAIGAQGLKAYVEGLGTFGLTAFYGTPDDVEATATIHRALDLGVTMFDSADIYGFGQAERLLGRALAGRRGEAVIATKVGGRLPGHQRGVAGSIRRAHASSGSASWRTHRWVGGSCRATSATSRTCRRVTSAGPGPG
ncbi:hypothetical protein Ais01nite_46920 [Asanoa ishikariensis]|uniref:aldo/keto reductase n=1 Tax=Asanoa ishikariensis TaxID=137265 RepID=UPI001A5741F7|nr:aldo/keto reductase [Asanoa ishikariensis]GIF66657.1 hypothetical protein Ais01nite_46920 [Asanoa ishikariensis]